MPLPLQPLPITVVPIEVLEGAKENVMPSVSGHRASSMPSAITTDHYSRATSQAQERQRFEQRLNDPFEDDLLSIYAEYIRWYQDRLLVGTTDWFKLLERATAAFMSQKEYYNNIQLVRIWLLYAQNSAEPRDIYQFMEAHGIGREQAAFYAEYAEYAEKVVLSKSLAMDILQRGLDRGAKPSIKLSSKMEQLRASQLMDSQNSQTLNNSSSAALPSRMPLTSNGSSYSNTGQLNNSLSINGSNFPSNSATNFASDSASSFSSNATSNFATNVAPFRLSASASIPSASIPSASIPSTQPRHAIHVDSPIRPSHAIFSDQQTIPSSGINNPTATTAQNQPNSRTALQEFDSLNISARRRENHPLPQPMAGTVHPIQTATVPSSLSMPGPNRFHPMGSNPIASSSNGNRASFAAYRDVHAVASSNGKPTERSSYKRELYWKGLAFVSFEQLKLYNLVCNHSLSSAQTKQPLLAKSRPSAQQTKVLSEHDETKVKTNAVGSATTSVSSIDGKKQASDHPLPESIDAKSDNMDIALPVRTVSFQSTKHSPILYGSDRVNSKQNTFPSSSNSRESMVNGQSQSTSHASNSRTYSTSSAPNNISTSTAPNAQTSSPSLPYISGSSSASASNTHTASTGLHSHTSSSSVPSYSNKAVSTSILASKKTDLPQEHSLIPPVNAQKRSRPSSQKGRLASPTINTKTALMEVYGLFSESVIDSEDASADEEDYMNGGNGHTGKMQTDSHFMDSFLSSSVCPSNFLLSDDCNVFGDVTAKITGSALENNGKGMSENVAPKGTSSSASFSIFTDSTEPSSMASNTAVSSSRSNAAATSMRTNTESQTMTSSTSQTMASSTSQSMTSNAAAKTASMATPISLMKRSGHAFLDSPIMKRSNSNIPASHRSNHANVLKALEVNPKIINASVSTVSSNENKAQSNEAKNSSLGQIPKENSLNGKTTSNVPSFPFAQANIVHPFTDAYIFNQCKLIPATIRRSIRQCPHKKIFPRTSSSSGIFNTGDNLSLDGDSFVIRGVLGEGSFGTVYHAVCLPDSNMTIRLDKILKSTAGSSSATACSNDVALKIQKPSCQWEYYILQRLHSYSSVSGNTDENSNARDQKQAELLNSIDYSRYIVHPLDLYVAEDAGCLAMEFGPNGTLLDVINSHLTVHESLHELVVLEYARQLLQAVAHLHARRIIHTDIKCENILVMTKPSTAASDANGKSSDTITTNGKSELAGRKEYFSIRLFDFNRSIDDGLSPEGTLYADRRTTVSAPSTTSSMHGFGTPSGNAAASGMADSSDEDEQEACDMLKAGLPFKFNMDYYDIAGAVYTLLFQDFMEVVQVADVGGNDPNSVTSPKETTDAQSSNASSTGTASKWFIKKKLARWWNVPFWTAFFDFFLNVSGMDGAASGQDADLVYGDGSKSARTLVSWAERMAGLLDASSSSSMVLNRHVLFLLDRHHPPQGSSSKK